MCLVSILIPVFNREDLITETINSALQQTYKNIEIVVSDNNSTDSTVLKVKKFQKKDSRIKLLQNKTNIGPVRNWKNAANHANGKYSLLLFSDDLISPEFISETIEFIKNPNIGLALTSVKVGENIIESKVHYQLFSKSGIYKSKDLVELLITKNNSRVSPGGILMRTSSLQKNIFSDIHSPKKRFYEKNGAGVDLLLILLTAKDHNEIYFSSKPLCFYRAHKGSITTSDDNSLLGEYYLQAKIYFAVSFLTYSLQRKFLSETYLDIIRNNRKFIKPKTAFADYIFDVKILRWIDISRTIVLKLSRKLLKA
jgi:glycosyltransferase involved in cell wall biosynthesis